MVPDYRITADGIEITATIQRLLTSLEIIDKAGIESDTLTLTLDDREAVMMPRTGAELSLSLGYQESGLIPSGRWIVNEVALASPPARMILRARAANLATSPTRAGTPQTLRSHKTRSWERISLGGIARAIAAEHGLIAAIDAIYDAGTPPSIGALIPFMAQLDESDMHLMTRLAHTAGARFRIVEGRLLLTPEASSVSASGQSMAATVITPDQLTQYHASFSDRALGIRQPWAYPVACGYGRKSRSTGRHADHAAILQGWTQWQLQHHRDTPRHHRSWFYQLASGGGVGMSGRVRAWYVIWFCVANHVT